MTQTLWRLVRIPVISNNWSFLFITSMHHAHDTHTFECHLAWHLYFLRVFFFLLMLKITYTFFMLFLYELSSCCTITFFLPLRRVRLLNWHGSHGGGVLGAVWLRKTFCSWTENVWFVCFCFYFLDVLAGSLGARHSACVTGWRQRDEWLRDP